MENKVPKNETEVLMLVNEALEMLSIIKKHTKMNNTYLNEAIGSLDTFRRFHYVDYVDWGNVKVDKKT